MIRISVFGNFEDFTITFSSSLAMLPSTYVVEPESIREEVLQLLEGKPDYGQLTILREAGAPYFIIKALGEAGFDVHPNSEYDQALKDSMLPIPQEELDRIFKSEREKGLVY